MNAGNGKAPQTTQATGLLGGTGVIIQRTGLRLFSVDLLNPQAALHTARTQGMSYINATTGDAATPTTS